MYYQNQIDIIPYQIYIFRYIVIRKKQYIVIRDLRGVVDYGGTTECLLQCYVVPIRTSVQSTHTTRNSYNTVKQHANTTQKSKNEVNKKS